MELLFAITAYVCATVCFCLYRSMRYTPLYCVLFHILFNLSMCAVYWLIAVRCEDLSFFLSINALIYWTGLIVIIRNISLLCMFELVFVALCVKSSNTRSFWCARVCLFMRMCAYVSNLCLSNSRYLLDALYVFE